MAKNNKPPTPTIQQHKETLANKFITAFGDRTFLQITVLVLFPFFIFIKVAGFQFINLDDVAIIQNNYEILSSFKNIGIAFKTDAFLGPHGDYYRPIQTVSFMLDALIGKDNPWIYHVMELIYHLLTVVSLYYSLIFFNLKKISSFIFCLLFSLHPMVSAAVSWVPARGDVLIGLFGILLVLNFAKYLVTNKPIYFILHAILFLVAAFTKETTVLFPVILLAYYFFVAKQQFSIKKLLPFGILWLSVIVVFLVLRSNVVSGTPPDFIFGISPFFQNLPTIPITLGKLILPFNLSTLPLFEPIFTTIGCVLLLVIGVVIYKKIKTKEWLPILGFGWFLLFIIPPMFFKLYYSKFLLEYYEHRMYLPVIGIIIFAAYLFNKKLLASTTQHIIWLPAALIIIFTPIATIHSDDFKNSIAFFSRATELNNPGAATKRGEEYMNERDVTNALADFENAIQLSQSEYPPAFYNRGLVNMNFVKDYKAAEADFTTTVILDTGYFDAFIKRGEVRILQQNIGGALSDLQKAKQFTPKNPKIFHTEGKAYVTAQQFETALANFTTAIQLDSNNAEAFNDRAFVNYRLQQFDSSMADCNSAIALNPAFLNAYYNKGMIFYERRLSDSAIKQFDITLSLANNFYFGYFYRGMAKLQKKDMNGACYDWQESVKLGFAMAQDTIKKYCK